MRAGVRSPLSCTVATRRTYTSHMHINHAITCALCQGEHISGSPFVCDVDDGVTVQPNAARSTAEGPGLHNNEFVARLPCHNYVGCLSGLDGAFLGEPGVFTLRVNGTDGLPIGAGGQNVNVFLR